MPQEVWLHVGPWDFLVLQAFSVKSGNGSEERVALAESDGWGVSRCVGMEEREMSARMEGHIPFPGGFGGSG